MQLGGPQINCIEMIIKVAFVILLSVEIEACKPRNNSPRFHRVLQQTWPRVNSNTVFPHVVSTETILF